MADEQSTMPPPDDATSAQTTDVPATDSSSTSASASSAQPPSPSPGVPPSPAPSSHSSSSSTPSSPPLPPLPSALYDALHPALSQCDTAIESVFTSQSQLASHIDTLAALLAQFNALHTTSAQLFSPYTAKLQSAKKRIRRLQTSVDRINGRLNDMRDTVRRKEGLSGGGGAAVGVGGLAGRLSLSSIAVMAQQALAVGGGAGGGGAEMAGSAVGAGARIAVDVDEEKEEEDESVGEEVGEIEKIEALAPVLDKSTTPTTYGSLPASLPSPTATSSPATPAQHDSTNSSAAVAGGSATATVTAGAAALSKSSSASSAPSNTALLHDLLAWDGQ